jgi:hypothetical protein
MRTKTFLLASALAAMAALLTGCVENPSPAARRRLAEFWGRPPTYAGADEVTIKLARGKDDKLYFPLKVNGHVLKVVIDTGSKTVFDLGTMRAIGITGYPTSDAYYGFGGFLHVHAGLVEEIDLGGMKILGLSAIMVDLAELVHSQAAVALPPIDGLVGTDLLAPLAAKIDYATLTLTLKRPPSTGDQNASPTHP